MRHVCLMALFSICARAQTIPFIENIVTCNVNLKQEAKRSLGFAEDAYLNVSEIITKYGYPVEEHNAITSDGYILTMIRIPRGRRIRGKPGAPVLLVHGMADSPATWVLTGPGHGLGYQLADAGYDVWLGSFRGGRYTRHHISLDPDRDLHFWKFGTEQIAAHDTPAMIGRVLRETERPTIAYVGHSVGCRIFFEMAGFEPQLYAKINSMSCLGPVVFLGNIYQPIVRLIIPFVPYIEAIANTLGFQEIFGSNSVLTQLIQLLCGGRQFFSVGFQEEFCAKIIFLSVGDDYDQLRRDLMPVIFGHVPNGISLMMYKQLLQGIMSKKFQRFDFGFEENLKTYGKPSPPEYDLSNVTTPVSIVVGKNDWSSSIKDAEILRSRLPNVFDFHVIPHYSWQHSDFVWARDAPLLVNSRIIQILQKYT